MASTSTLHFQCALITGGGSPTSIAIAKYLTSRRKKVVLAGPDEDSLQRGIREVGANCFYRIFHESKTNDVPDFVTRIIADYPHMDCLIINSREQKQHNVATTMDAKDAEIELNVNIRIPIHLTTSFLPHFRSETNGGVIINVTGSTGFFPSRDTSPVYNATQAWLHSWTVNLRAQLRQVNVRVVELVVCPYPESMSEKTATRHLREGFEENKDCIAIGSSRKYVRAWYKAFM